MNGEEASSKMHPNMGQHAGNVNKSFVDSLSDKLKLTYLNNGLGHSSD